MQSELATRLTQAGVPIERMMMAIPTLYASRRGLATIWSKERGAEWMDLPWGNRAEYEASPFYVAHQTREWVELRLEAATESAFPIAEELREQGFTHYVCLPVFFQDGEGGVTFATRDPDGFPEASLAVIREIEPALSMLLDLRRAQRLLNETLQMYVGDEPHRLVLNGKVKRGDVQHIDCAIISTDLRGFTAASNTQAAEDIVDMLNRYFDCVVPPIEAHGGQVLKFIGDGVLAIFRVKDDADAAAAAAFSAAQDIVQTSVQLHASKDTHPIKIALHCGNVAYGNIGSGNRLDFTVIGKAVNTVSRLTDLCGHLDAPLLASSKFVSLLPENSCKSLGHFDLRGLPGKYEAFTIVA